MQGITLAVALFFSALALTLRPAYALGAFITSLLWYPSWLRVSLGTIDISVGRIVAMVLLFRCLCDSRMTAKFIWSRLDTWVSLSMVVYVGVLMITMPGMATVENRGGYVMDTWLAYMVARLIITDRATLIAVVKFVAVALIPLAILGVTECITGWQPFNPLKRFRPYLPGTGDMTGKIRWGLTRANGPITHPIKFGCAFAMFLPLVYWMRRHWGAIAYGLWALVLVGALSSMSSGPWVMAIVIVFCLALERYKHLVKPLIIFVVVCCILVQVISNRNFYHVIASYASLLGGAGAHRAKLVDCAIDSFGEWWMLGYGGVDPGWGPRLGMAHTDVTNMFILNGVFYGIAGIVALCGTLVVAFHRVIRLHNSTADPVQRSWAWALGCWLVGVVMGFMSVSFSGQIESLFYVILGILGSSTYPARNDNGMAVAMLPVEI